MTRGDLIVALGLALVMLLCFVLAFAGGLEGLIH